MFFITMILFKVQTMKIVLNTILKFAKKIVLKLNQIIIVKKNSNRFTTFFDISLTLNILS